MRRGDLGARRRHERRCARRRTTRAAIFAAARAGDSLAREVVDEEARRIALHIAPIAAVTDVGLVVLGGGIGANGDLLSTASARSSRVAADTAARRGSSLGDAAVLTGALAVGLRAARENVFVNRRARPIGSAS